MNIRRFAMAAGMAGVMLSAVSVAAKQAGGGPPQPPAQAGVGQTSAVTLKVTVTISRWDAEKKVSNSPYVLMVVPSYPYEMTQVKEMVMQRGTEPPMRMPEQMLGMMRGRMPNAS